MTTVKSKAARKSAKKAEKQAYKAAEVAQERAAELADLAARAGAVAQQRGNELAERLRESNVVAKAQAKGTEGLTRAQEKGTELAELARSRWHEAELDTRAAELAKQMRETDVAKQASRRAKDVSEASLAAVGGWLATGPAADKLGLTRKRRVPSMVWLALGAVLGFVAGKLLSQPSDGSVREDLAAAAERLASEAPPPVGDVLADTIRTTLQGDPRTAALRELNINVAEGTVFVRGSIPSGIDANAIREVIEGVPGVQDVDLQLTPAV